jgi:hypothetical protein
MRKLQDIREEIMCTKKKRERCWRCKRRLIIDKLQEVKRGGKIRFQCVEPFCCEYIVSSKVR